jgi:cation diffusion facilitator family transporter
MEASNQEERRTLIAVLVINATMFVVEFVAGLLSQSTGLTADSLDMLADAGVYGISLYAIGRAITIKQRAAFYSGVVQITLGLGVLVEVFRKLMVGSEPMSGVILIVAGIALLANSVCVVLLAKHRNGEVHLQASWIFTTNDVIANAGVMLSGLFVWLLESRLPDLIVGLVISLIVIRGGVRIVRRANRADKVSQ